MKINANIGNSAVSSDINGEIEKLGMAVKYGPTVQVYALRSRFLHGLRSEDNARRSRALERHQWKDVDREISRVAMALTREATLVGQLAEELSQLK